MANEKKPGKQKDAEIQQTSTPSTPLIVPKPAPTRKTGISSSTSSTGITTSNTSTDQTASTGKQRDGKKENRPRIGGTAVPGAKSTQPRQIPATNASNQQQAESYNREMRRRMERMGTGGPHAEEERLQTMQEKRKKRVTRRKERLEERREELRKSLPSGRVSLGRRNTYFLIAVVALLVLIILAFVILRFVLHTV